jgi:PilZ domain-containing protein
MDTQDPSVASQPREARLFVERADRRELSVPIRFRRAGTEDWLIGETINLSESGLLFTTNELLDVDARLEITFQTSGTPLLARSVRPARIVRRMLSNWPETRIIFAVAYSTF